MPALCCPRTLFSCYFLQLAVCFALPHLILNSNQIHVRLRLGQDGPGWRRTCRLPRAHPNAAWHDTAAPPRVRLHGLTAHTTSLPRASPVHSKRVDLDWESAMTHYFYFMFLITLACNVSAIIYLSFELWEGVCMMTKGKILSSLFHPLILVIALITYQN